MKTMLLVFAHPDDESLATGGTIAKYVRAGWKAHLVSATLGEAGSTGPYGEITPERLSDIRRKELEEAQKLLGISSLTFLGYRDGELKDQNPGELEDKIYKKMVEYAPAIVITFDPTGITNHPDHVKMMLSTTYAFQKYAYAISHPTLGRRSPMNRSGLAKRRFEETVSVTHEPKLYYVCMPESVAEYLKKERIVPEISFGKPWRGTPDKFVTTLIDTKRHNAIKMKAIQAHRSQKEDIDRILSPKAVRVLLHKEYFILRMQGEHEV
ncbi:MAG: PIG-L family deacetylase, partial [bacterium]|nr:PIG-L family deacetylase [bacterium]